MLARRLCRALCAALAVALAAWLGAAPEVRARRRRARAPTPSPLTGGVLPAAGTRAVFGAKTTNATPSVERAASQVRPISGTWSTSVFAGLAEPRSPLLFVLASLLSLALRFLSFLALSACVRAVCGALVASEESAAALAFVVLLLFCAGRAAVWRARALKQGAVSGLASRSVHSSKTFRSFAPRRRALLCSLTPVFCALLFFATAALCMDGEQEQGDKAGKQEASGFSRQDFERLMAMSATLLTQMTQMAAASASANNSSSSSASSSSAGAQGKRRRADSDEEDEEDFAQQESPLSRQEVDEANVCVGVRRDLGREYLQAAASPSLSQSHSAAAAAASSASADGVADDGGQASASAASSSAAMSSNALASAHAVPHSLVGASGATVEVWCGTAIASAPSFSATVFPWRRVDSTSKAARKLRTAIANGMAVAMDEFAAHTTVFVQQASAVGHVLRGALHGERALHEAGARSTASSIGVWAARAYAWAAAVAHLFSSQRRAMYEYIRFVVELSSVVAPQQLESLLRIEQMYRGDCQRVGSPINSFKAVTAFFAKYHGDLFPPAHFRLPRATSAPADSDAAESKKKKKAKPVGGALAKSDDVCRKYNDGTCTMQVGVAGVAGPNGHRRHVCSACLAAGVDNQAHSATNCPRGRHGAAAAPASSSSSSSSSSGSA
jgi:hypothetical protein